jgi:aminopeptidase YwaD
MKYLHKITLLFIINLSIANAQTFVQAYQNVVNQTNQTQVTNKLQAFESYGIKRRGTTALQNTLDWIKSEYTSYGYTVSQTQEYSFANNTFTCKNLEVTKVGTLYPNTFVILCAHYDTLNGTGTSDNGSGTAILLEIARLIRTIPTEYSVRFIHFSGEEDGLRGSQNYVNTVVNATTPKMDIKLVFNIDEVGGTANEINDTITCDVDQSTPTTNNAASTIITNELATCVDLYSPLNTIIAAAAASDYIPFENNNEVITGFYETNINTAVNHTINDTFANLDPVYVLNVCKAAIGATLHFANASRTLNNSSFDKDFNVSVFPNPAKNYFIINKGDLLENDYDFSIVDKLGKTVFKRQFDNSKLLETISTEHLSSGMYFGILKTTDNQIIKKIIIE